MRLVLITSKATVNDARYSWRNKVKEKVKARFKIKVKVKIIKVIKVNIH